MMSKETLRKLGILGVSFGLIASPLAFGDMHEEPTDPAAQSTGSAADPTQQADPAAGDPAADPNAQGDPALPGDDPAAQSTDSAADPSTQQADPAAGEPAGDPGFGEGTEAMPGADDSAAGGEEAYEYENEEQEAPWDEEGDSSEDEEQGA